MEIGDFKLSANTPHQGGKKSQYGCNAPVLGWTIWLATFENVLAFCVGGRVPFCFFYFFFFFNICFADLFGEHGYIFIE
jgi:hypothetical protein